MNKKELYELYTSKGISKEEIDSKAEEFRQWFKGKVADKDIEASVLSRIRTYYKKIEMGATKTYEVIIYGVDRVTDFGAKKLYDAAQDAYRANPQDAVARGLTNEEGKPMYSGNRAPKTGQPRFIDPVADRRKPIFMIARDYDEELAKKPLSFENFKLAEMMLGGDLIDEKIPVCKRLKLVALPSNKSTDDKLYLNMSKQTNFEVVEDKEVDVMEIVKKFLKANVCKNLNELVEWHNEHKDDKPRHVVIKGDVVTVKYLNQGMSNIINVDAEELAGVSNITVWAPTHLDVNFVDGTIGLIIIGQTNLVIDKYSQQEVVQINAINVWCPPAFRDTTQRENVDTNKIVEKKAEAKKEEKKVQDIGEDYDDF